MLRRLGIRGKILAALALPVLVLFALAGALSLQSVQSVQTARATQDMLDAMEQARAVTAALQDERDAALIAYRDAPPADAADLLAGAQSDTDRAIQRYRSAAAAVPTEALGALAEDAVARLEANLKALDNARSMLTAGSVPMGTLLSAYSNVVATTVAFPRSVAGALPDRELALVVDAQVAVQELVENYRTEQVLGREVLAGQRDHLPTLVSLFAESDELHFDVSTQLFDLGNENITLTSGLLATQGFDSYDSLRDRVSASSGAFLDSIDPQVFYETAHGEINVIDALHADIADVASARAGSVSDAALRTAALTIAGALTAVVISVVVALSISQAIASRVRRLTQAAGHVRDELPRLVEQVAIPGQGPDMSLTQIPVDSRDEVGLLAVAFNEVNATTIEVAQEQAALRASIAEMFVNVARRDQVLLNRQLSFIDALERSEEDPKTLADLFRLDHLATRMRRNAESLLVLAGIDTGRRLREGLPTSDVIRTASSEIEHYERIQIDLPVDPVMVGHTALPAAHLLAEILENATVFSEPGTPVHVSTGVDQTHVLVTVLDQGLGMTPDELADANAKIHATSASDVLGAQRLGLFVVGRLAQRLGAQVDIGHGPDGTGTLVTVRFPLILFVGAEQLPQTAPTAATVRHEEFVPPEAVAQAFSTGHVASGPIALGALGAVPDVAPGQLGSAENPAQEVDLTALTDGTTQLGLPRRRARVESTGGAMRSDEERDAEDAASASALPTAPSADMFAGVSTGLDDDAWTPPTIQEAAPLVVRRPRREEAEAESAAPAGFAPEPPTTTAGTGLPVRRPSGVSGIATPPSALASSAGPVHGGPAPAGASQPQERSAMFSGFRSRRAELAAAAVHVENDAEAPAMPPTEPAVGIDGAERLAAAAAFFGRAPVDRGEPAPVEEPAETHGAPVEPEPSHDFVVPALVEDDDEVGDPLFAPGAPAAVVEPSYEERSQRADVYLGRHALPPIDEPHVPEQVSRASRGAHVLDHERTGESDRFATPSLMPDQPARPDQPVSGMPAWSAVAETPGAPLPTRAAAQQPTAPEPAQPAVEDTWAASPAWSPVAADAPARSLPERPAYGQPQAPQPESYAGWPAPERESVFPPAGAASSPMAPSAPVPTGALGAAPASPFAPVGMGAAAAAAPESEEPKKRRRWFGRKKDTDEAAPAQEPAAEPEIRTGFGHVDGSRPSWATPTPATPAAQPTPSAPEPDHGSLRPAAFEPAPFEPAPFERAPFERAPFDQPPAQPAPVSYAPDQDFGGAVPAPHRPSAVEQAQRWQPPVVDIPQAAVQSDEGWAPSQAWATPSAAEERPTLPPRGPAAPSASGTTFTPAPVGGFFDDEVTNMLAQKADIAQQALAELSQLSSYRPKAGSESSTPLVRRTPGTIPAAPAIERKPAGQRTERDADQVRSLLSSFQSGTSRGRRESVGDDTGLGVSPDPNTGAGHGGESHGEPVHTPDADLTPRSTSW